MSSREIPRHHPPDRMDAWDSIFRRRNNLNNQFGIPQAGVCAGDNAPELLLPAPFGGGKKAGKTTIIPIFPPSFERLPCKAFELKMFGVPAGRNKSGYLAVGYKIWINSNIPVLG